MTEATDRSMLRVRMTSIWPTATIVSRPASIASALRLAPLSMRGLTATTGTMTASIASSRPSSRRTTSRRSQPAGRSTGPGSAAACRAGAGFGAGGIGHGVEHALLGRLGRRQLGGDPALAQHHDPVAHAQQLGQLRGDQDDGEALAREVGDDRVDLGLGLHVDALGRLVQDQHARLGRQPLGQHDLLLVAAGQRLDRLQVAPEPQAQAVEVAAHEAQLARRPDQAGHGRLVDDRQGGVGEDREVHHQALADPVLRDVGDAGRHGVAGRARTRPRARPARSCRRSAGRRRTARARSRCGRCRPGRRSPGSRRRAPRSTRRRRRRRGRGRWPPAPRRRASASRSGYMWLSARPTISRTARSRGISSVGAVATSCPSRSTVTRSATR